MRGGTVVLTWLRWLRERPLVLVSSVALVAVVAGIVVAAGGGDDPKPITIGKVASPKPPKKTEPGVPEVEVPKRLAPDPLLGANGMGPGAALPFRGAVNVPGDLKFFLVIGSDARPGQDPARARADSLHIAAVDPQTREGTVLGLPRDSWVNVPGHGQQKINSALALGGPELMVQTVRDLTGFPIEYYALTAFEGLTRMVDELEGLDVNVPYRMDDRYSGSRFEPGWHHMNGAQVLAFTRARHGVPGGDFGRSENQGRVIVHALEKLRAKTKDEGGVRFWLSVLFKHCKLDMSMDEAVDLGVFARQLMPGDLKNVVAPGAPGSMGGQSVVVLSDAAYELFKDVGADAVADGNRERGTPKEPLPTPTKKPTPKPTPKKTPVPSPVPSSGVPLPVG